MARPVLEQVMVDETCLVCEQGFGPNELGVPFKVDNTLRWQHMHVRCREEHSVRIDLSARLGRALRAFARRLTRRSE
jgi:hypothetical protein